MSAIILVYAASAACVAVGVEGVAGQRRWARTLIRTRGEVPIDPVTGLPIMSALAHRLSAELSRSRRFETTLWCAVIECRSPGAPQFGRKLAAAIHTSAFAAILGPTRFAVLQPESDAERRGHLVERIRGCANGEQIVVGEASTDHDGTDDALLSIAARRCESCLTEDAA